MSSAKRRGIDKAECAAMSWFVRYFSHRPFAFWFTTSVLGIALLVGAYIVGVNAEASAGEIAAPPTMQTVTGDDRSRILAQYGRLAGADNTADAEVEAKALAENVKNCADLGNSTCAAIVREATQLSSWLAKQSPAYFEPGDDVYEEYFLKRRNIGSYVNELITSP